MCPFQVGETVYAIGLNMACKPVIVKITVVQVFPRNAKGHDCTTESKGGVKVLTDSRQLFKSKADAKASIAQS